MIEVFINIYLLERPFGETHWDSSATLSQPQLCQVKLIKMLSPYYAHAERLPGKQNSTVKEIKATEMRAEEILKIPGETTRYGGCSAVGSSTLLSTAACMTICHHQLDHPADGVTGVMALILRLVTDKLIE